MGIYRRKGRLIYDYKFTISGHDYYGVTGTSDRITAEKVYHKKRTEAVLIDQGFARKKYPLREVMNDYLDNYAVMKFNERNYRSHVTLFNEMLQVWGVGVDANDVTLDYLTQWSNYRIKKGVAKITVDHDICALRAAYNHRVAAGDKLALPMENYTWCSKEEKRNRRMQKVRIMDPEQFEKFLGYCPITLYRYLVFFYSTGLRPIEIRDTRWDDIVWDRSEIYTRRTKGGRDGVIPLTSGVIQMLSQMPRISDYIFGTERGKAGDSTYRFQFEAAREAFIAVEKVKSFRAYDFRHSFATYMLENGSDPKTISECLGQTTMAMMDEFYLHITSSRKRKALELVPNRVFSRLQGCIGVARQISVTSENVKKEMINQ